MVHRGNPVIPAEAGREVARRIPGARFVEVPGEDYGFAVGDVDRVIDEVEEFLTGSRPRAAGGRALSTILFTDIVDSTVRAVELGDARWRELLEAHEALCEREVKTFGGVVSDFTGDGVLASFDGPARAICTSRLRDKLRGLGLEMRAGPYRERSSGGASAWPESASTSPRASFPSPAGRGARLSHGRRSRCRIRLHFIDRGTHALKGIDNWQVLAAAEARQ